jgi:hypothetical protein
MDDAHGQCVVKGEYIDMHVAKGGHRFALQDRRSAGGVKVCSRCAKYTRCVDAQAAGDSLS